MMGKSKLVNRASGLGSLIMGEPGDLKTSNVGVLKFCFTILLGGGGGCPPPPPHPPALCGLLP